MPRRTMQIRITFKILKRVVQCFCASVSLNVRKHFQNCRCENQQTPSHPASHSITLQVIFQIIFTLWLFSQMIFTNVLHSWCKCLSLEINKSGCYPEILLNPYKHSVPFLGNGKRCRPRSDAAERGVWSGSSLFANKNINSKLNKNGHQAPQKLEMDSSNW